MSGSGPEGLGVGLEADFPGGNPSFHRLALLQPACKSFETWGFTDLVRAGKVERAGRTGLSLHSAPVCH